MCMSGHNLGPDCKLCPGFPAWLPLHPSSGALCDSVSLPRLEVALMGTANKE